MKRLCTLFKIILTFLVFAFHISANAKSANQNEVRAYDIMVDLVHNHTFDPENIAIADSLYAEGEELNSIYIKMYALRIKFYALANGENDDEFSKAINEFNDLSLELEEYGQYFDGMSAKIQYFMGRGDYAKCMFLAKDMLDMAKKLKSYNGLYESNLMLGQVYKYRKNYRTAIKYLDNSLKHLKMVDSNTDSIGHCLVFRDLSECYASLNQYDKAVDFARLACNYANYDLYRYVSEFSLLNAIYSTGNMKLFRDTYKGTSLSMQSVESLDDLISVEMSRQLQVMILSSNGKYDEALAAVGKLQMRDSKLVTLKNLYYIMGDYKRAYEASVELDIFNDSIIAGIQQDELTEYDARLDNAILRAQAEEERGNRNKILMVSVSVLFILVIASLIFWLYRRRVENEHLQIEQLKTAEALAKAEKANAMRAAFIQNMTHEFRTPINSIVGFAQVLDMYELDDEQKELSKNIVNAGLSLAHLLDDVIRISEYDTSDAEPQLTDLNPSTLISDAIATSPQPDSQRVQIITANHLPADFSFRSNKEMVTHMLGNLISNAVKFTEDGTITVEALQSDSNTVRFVVTDTGKGIPAGMEEEIFERFRKLDNFIPGTGLGLSFCRIASTRLGGNVFVDTSYKEKGARFVVELPLSR